MTDYSAISLADARREYLASSTTATGDIFKFDGDLWVVLTPQCDMATQKVDSAILAKCVPGITDWKKMIDMLAAQESPNTIERSSRFLSRFVNQNVEPSKHFLPALPGEVEPLLVHFSSVMTKPLADLNAGLEHRITSIATPFLSNIVQRFGAYIAKLRAQRCPVPAHLKFHFPVSGPVLHQVVTHTCTTRLTQPN